MTAFLSLVILASICAFIFCLIKIVVDIIKKKHEKKKWLIRSALFVVLFFIAGFTQQANLTTEEKMAIEQRRMEQLQKKELEKEENKIKSKEQENEGGKKTGLIDKLFGDKAGTTENEKRQTENSEKEGFFARLFEHKEVSEDDKKIIEYKTNQKLLKLADDLITVDEKYLKVWETGWISIVAGMNAGYYDGYSYGKRMREIGSYMNKAQDTIDDLSIPNHLSYDEEKELKEAKDLMKDAYNTRELVAIEMADYLENNTLTLEKLHGLLEMLEEAQGNTISATAHFVNVYNARQLEFKKSN